MFVLKMRGEFLLVSAVENITKYLKTLTII